MSLAKSNLLQQVSDHFIDLEREANRLIDSWPSLGDQRHIHDHLCALGQQLQDQAHLSAPLTLLFLGGTGVGKSSLLNAIAQHELSSVSHTTRAHSATFTLYLHECWRELMASSDCHLWDEESLAYSRVEYHQIDRLQALCFIDAPDVDSILEVHKERVMHALTQVDVPLWVSSPQKYRDRACQKVLQLIDHRRPLIAVMNQLDLVENHEKEELLEDAYQFCVSLGFTDIQFHQCSVVTHSSVMIPSSANNELEVDAITRLRNQLVHRFDLKERQRLQHLAFAQRLNEGLSPLALLVAEGRREQVKLKWQCQSRTVLTPLIRQVLMAQIQLDVLRYPPPSSQVIEAKKSASLQAIFTQVLKNVETIIWPLLSVIYQSTAPLSLEQDLSQAKTKLRTEELRCLRASDEWQASPQVLGDPQIFRQLLKQSLPIPSISSLQKESMSHEYLPHLMARLVIYSSTLWLVIMGLCLSYVSFNAGENLFGFIQSISICLFVAMITLLLSGWWVYQSHESIIATFHEECRSTLIEEKIEDFLVTQWVQRVFSCGKGKTLQRLEDQNLIEISPEQSLFLDRYESSFHLFESSVQAIFEEA